MAMSDVIARLQAAVEDSDLNFVETDEGVDVVALEEAPVPLVGKVTWSPPPSYVEFLEEIGHFSLRWEYQGDVEGVIQLLTPEEISEYSEVVYLPDGVNFGDGDDDLSTNHLVPFAAFDGEACFCFDVTGDDPEYSVWYHHQDNDRTFRWSSSGEAVDPDAEPDFGTFTDWANWLIGIVESGAVWDELELDTPHFSR